VCVGDRDREWESERGVRTMEELNFADFFIFLFLFLSSFFFLIYVVKAIH